MSVLFLSGDIAHTCTEKKCTIVLIFFFKHCIFNKIESRCFCKGNKDYNICCICENNVNPKYCTLCAVH